MITQYPWASVKNQQRKHIEIGMMVTLMLAIVTFYAVPEFGTTAPVVEEFVAPPIDVLKIPATRQEPVKPEPITPKIRIAEEAALDIDIDLPVFVDYEGADIGLLEPPVPPIPIVDFFSLEVKPIPVGGWSSIMANVIYPEIAREAGIDGRVTIKALIGADGIVEEAFVYSGVPRSGLNDAALAAVMMTPFEPAYQRDKPVRVWINIPIHFKLTR